MTSKLKNSIKLKGIKKTNKFYTFIKNKHYICANQLTINTKKMKIYNPEPPILVRIQITRQLEQTYYLTLCETTRKEVINFCKKIIKNQKLDPFIGGKKTALNIRDAIGGKNLKSETISFYGLSTEETYNLIYNHLTK